jgi:hypothetical protein
MPDPGDVGVQPLEATTARPAPIRGSAAAHHPGADLDERHRLTSTGGLAVLSLTLCPAWPMGPKQSWSLLFHRIETYYNEVATELELGRTPACPTRLRSRGDPALPSP